MNFCIFVVLVLSFVKGLTENIKQEMELAISVNIMSFFFFFRQMIQITSSSAVVMTWSPVSGVFVCCCSRWKWWLQHLVRLDQIVWSQRERSCRPGTEWDSHYYSGESKCVGLQWPRSHRQVRSSGRGVCEEQAVRPGEAWIHDITTAGSTKLFKAAAARGCKERAGSDMSFHWCDGNNSVHMSW